MQFNFYSCCCTEAEEERKATTYGAPPPSFWQPPQWSVTLKNSPLKWQRPNVSEPPKWPWTKVQKGLPQGQNFGATFWSPTQWQQAVFSSPQVQGPINWNPPQWPFSVNVPQWQLPTWQGGIQSNPSTWPGTQQIKDPVKIPGAQTFNPAGGIQNKPPVRPEIVQNRPSPWQEASGAVYFGHVANVDSVGPGQVVIG